MTSRSEIPQVPVSNPPDGATWRALFEASEALRQMAPWKWLNETHIFGVCHPATAHIGYVSVTGALEGPAGVMVYLGPEGWEIFWTVMEFLATVARVPEELAWETSGLRLFWAPLEELDDVDRRVGEFLGLTSEHTLWPVWRRLTPGYMPWYLTAEDASFLRVILEQTLAVASTLAEQSPDLLLDRLAQGEVLVRVARAAPQGIVWENVWYPLPPSVSPPYRGRIAQTHLVTLRRAISRETTVEVDVFPLPTAVQTASHEPPAIPYVVLVVEHETGQVILGDLLTPRGALRRMYETVPDRVVAALAAWGRPQQVVVRRPLVHTLLRPLEEENICPVTQRATLPALDEVRWYLVRRVQETTGGTTQAP